MAFKKKEVGFTPHQLKEIQSYANDNYDGNFNMAVRQLVKKGLTNDSRPNNE
jgi:hypothetical protein